VSLKRILIGVVILAALGGVGLFILDRTIFAPVQVNTGVPIAPTLAAPTTASTELPAAPTNQPAAAPTIASSAPTPPAANDTPGARVYRIDAAQSEVRYEVGETLFRNNRFQTAIGRTSGVAGDVLVDFAQPSNSQIGEIVIDVSQFTSDETRRDNYIRREGLQSSQYPYARFVPRSIEGLPDQAAPGEDLTFTLVGDLTVKETTLPVTWIVTLRVEDDRLVGSAATEILMSDFGVGPIQVASLVTEDLVKLHFDFVAAPVEGS
jgi:polyisoprenoid-binding protein YceI